MGGLLEIELSKRHDLITRLTNSAAGALTGPDLTHSIIEEHKLSSSGPGPASLTKATDSGSNETAPDFTDTLPLRPTGLREECVRAALLAPAFLAAADKAKSLSGRGVIEEYMLSGSTLMVRATLLGESWLLARSTDLSVLSTARTYLTAHFERCLTLDPEQDSVPARLARFRYPMAEVKLALKGEFHKLSLVNAPAGFLAVTELRQG